MSTNLPPLPEIPAAWDGVRTQMLSLRLAAWNAAIEAAAEAMSKRADDVRKANTYRGRIGSASMFVIDQLEFGACAIRSMMEPLPEPPKEQDK